MSKLVFKADKFELALKNRLYSFNYDDLRFGFLHEPKEFKKYNLHLPFNVWLKIFKNKKI